MTTHDENTPGTQKDTIHCWDPQARRMVCGSPGQIGSTKHIRDVTCDACLDLLRKTNTTHEEHSSVTLAP